MKFGINWAAWGIGASIACAIHCAILPLAFSSLPLFGVNIIHNHYFEAGMVVLALVVGLIALKHGFSKHHHSLVPSILFVLGITLLGLKLLFVHYELWILVPAVICIVSAHFINYRLCRKHDHAHHDDCDH
ncbi:MAG: MerC domain-containing protein [Pedobacter sp.]|nr:MAG: MerC domain-containing protein [Pedobacter sp.]